MNGITVESKKKVWIATSYTVNVGCLGRLGSGKAQQVK